MAFPIGLAIGGVIEAIKLGADILEAHNNGTLTQEEFDAKWATMQASLRDTNSRWEASKAAQGQT